MQAAVVAVGDELTSGQRVDTNSAWLSARLGELGIPVALHATAPDALATCAATLRFACQQSQIVIVTGGLGPTQDDLTRDAIADVCGVELQLDEPSRAHIADLFASRNRKMPASNLRQAMLPKGATAIRNPHGSAPGISVCVADGHNETHLFALPGVPAEMKEMWAAVETAIVALQERGGAANFTPRVIAHRSLQCFGIGESALEEQIHPFLRRGREPSIGITVHRATITLRITATGASTADCAEALNEDALALREKLGSLVFGEDDQQLQDVLISALAAQSETLATTECATRGLISRWLSAADPGGRYFGGATYPSGIPLSLKSVDECWEEAHRLRSTFTANCAIVIGAIDQQRQTVPVVALHGQRDSVEELRWAGHPDIREELTAKRALNMLRLLIKNRR